jgi:hypothetical protein
MFEFTRKFVENSQLFSLLMVLILNDIYFAFVIKSSLKKLTSVYTYTVTYTLEHSVLYDYAHDYVNAERRSTENYVVICIM